MPNRVIRDGFLDSPRVDALNWFAECVYHRLLLAVDDAGRIDGRSSVLKSRLFPLKDRLRASDVERGVNQLEEHGLVVRWEVGDQVVIQVTRWRRCGNAQYSRYPDPDGNFEIRYVEVQTRDGPVQMVASSLMTPPSHPNTPRSHPDPAEHPHQRWESKIDVSHTDPIQTPSASHPYTKTKTIYEDEIYIPPNGGSPEADASAPPVFAVEDSGSNGKTACDLKRAIERLEAAWNAIAGLVSVRQWSEQRKQRLRTRLRDPTWLEKALAAIEQIPQCPFLLGDNDRGWRADIDWFLKPDSVTRILEGKYRKKEVKKKNIFGLEVH